MRSAADRWIEYRVDDDQHHVLIVPVVCGGWMLIVDGYQWGDDPALMDHGMGCSAQTWGSVAAAHAAWHAYRERQAAAEGAE